jgi:hypothetical protein
MVRLWRWEVGDEMMCDVTENRVGKNGGKAPRPCRLSSPLSLLQRLEDVNSSVATTESKIMHHLRAILTSTPA